MAGRARQGRQWEHSGRKLLTGNLFVFVVDGNATFNLNDTKYCLQKGDIMIVPSQTYYTVSTESFCEYYFVHFGGLFEPLNGEHATIAASRNFSFNLKRVEKKVIYTDIFVKSRPEDFGKLFTGISSCCEKRSSCYMSDRYLIDIEFLEILVMISKRFEEGITSESFPHTFEKLLFYIKNNLTKPISVSEMCSLYGISRSYAAKLFKKYLSITPTGYINREKLSYAAELLLNTALNVGEVSDHLGFCDVYYFSRMFKEHFGVPPSKYVRRIEK